jgi:hypothetical protein
MVAGLSGELVGVADAPALLMPEFKGISVLGSNGSRLVAAVDVADDDILATAPLAAATAELLAAPPTGCAKPVVGEVVEGGVRAELMLMSWSSWFSEII